MTRTDRGLEQLSPFQLKDELIRYAKAASGSSAATHKFLNAGRGNPNWIATTPREAFLLLGQFGLAESKRVWDEADIGGMPDRQGIAGRCTVEAGISPTRRLRYVRIVSQPRPSGGGPSPRSEPGRRGCRSKTARRQMAETRRDDEARAGRRSGRRRAARGAGPGARGVDGRPRSRFGIRYLRTEARDQLGSGGGPMQAAQEISRSAVPGIGYPVPLAITTVALSVIAYFFALFV
jgi:hypothetical protein